MLDAERHRGPDGRGAVAAGPLALGAVRLAVLDRTEAAAQPMATPDGRFLLAYNGEVYNFRDLRRELEAQGEAFRSAGDTEVVLRALARWGEAALDRLDGVFALALWDARDRALLLARDRFGARPLYWAQAGGALLFASEIKAVLASGRLRAGIDGAALAEIFRFQNVWSGRTLFAGIRPVPPAGVLRWRDGRLDARRRWRPVFGGGPGLGEEQAAGELRELLAAAVSRQTASDVPVGCALSGGLDGAAVASEAARASKGMPAFTIGFDLPGGAFHPVGERALDERPAARELAAFLGMRHREEEVTPASAIADLALLMRHLEEPRLAASFQNLATARLARRHATVVLSGGGGDELFAGYPWRYAQGLGAAWDRVRPPADFWTAEGRRLMAEGDPEGVLGALEREASGDAPLHRAMQVEAETFLPAFLVLEDKLHMAFGAEVRVPLLDGALADWALGLPAGLRLSPDRPDRPDGATGKRLLRRALAGRLPASVLEAPKQGFVPPLLGWASREPWAGFLRGTLTGRGLIRPEALGRDVDALASGDAEPLQRIWTALAFELWCREFLGP